MNGILDSLLKKLKKENRLAKTGRGLVDSNLIDSDSSSEENDQ